MKNNPTNSRKVSNTMHKGEGMYMPRTRSDVTGNNRALAFDGAMGTGVNRNNTRDSVCVNPNAHLITNPDRMNQGLIQANRKGNASDSHMDRMSKIGPSVTRDPNRMTISTAAQAGGCIAGGAARKPFANADKIYITRAER